MNDVSTITSDLNAMKQYLKDIYTLEKDRNCLNKDAMALTDKIAPLGQPREIKEPYVDYGRYHSLDGLTYPEKYHRPNIIELFGDGLLFVEHRTMFIGFLAGLFAGWLFGYWFSSFAFHGLASIIYISMIIGAVVGLISPIFKEAFELDKAERSLYKSRLEVIERDKKQLEQERKEEADRLAEENREKDTLTEAYDSTINTYNSCEKTLLHLYDMDIVYAKYRNLPSMAQIYEYFMADRVKTLGEAYNLYEQEIRMNKIISQLDVAISLLEEIRDTQYMLVGAIQQSNSLLAQIGSATSAIASNTAVMAYNTSVIASNTEIMARYTV